MSVVDGPVDPDDSWRATRICCIVSKILVQLIQMIQNLLNLSVVVGSS